MTPDRRTFLGTVALAASAVLLPGRAAASATRAPVPVPHGTPLRYGVLGDSITGRGSFASSEARTWTSLLQARLARTWPVTRVDGTTFWDSQGLTCLGTVETVPSGCDLVVVGLGTNDCRERSNGRYVYTPDGTTAAARALFAEVAAANPGAAVVSLGVWGDSSVRWAVNGSAHPVSRVEYWDELIGECCARSGGIPVRCADLYSRPSYRLPAGRPSFGGHTTDGFHPNDAGHEAIYQRVAHELRLP